MTDFLDCVRPADEGEPIDEDFDRAINEALDAEEWRCPVHGRQNAMSESIPPRCLTPVDGDRCGVSLISAAPILSPSDICHRSTWCCLREHPPDEPCFEKPRAVMGRTDFGPRRAVKVGWR